MSCQIKTIGYLKDVNKVKEILSGDAVARREFFYYSFFMEMKTMENAFL